MKTKQIHLLLALFAAVSANAQVPNPPGNRRPPPPQPLLAALDGNRDGALSADEIAASPAALAELDKNNDGMLTRQEILPPTPKKKIDGAGQPIRRGPPVLVRVLDLDKDGIISADEIKAAPQSLAELDKNADGALSRDELKPGKPPINPPTEN